jgi:lipoprotein-anchoring transpeptidase ErfK/SrfK
VTRQQWLIRGVGAASAALGVAGLAASAIISGAPAKEAGTGHAVVPAVVLAAPVPPPKPKPPAGPAPTYIATLHGPIAYAARPGGPAAGNLPALNPFGAPEVLAVLGRPAGGWAQVELPVRPNGSTGWVRTSGVALTQTSYRLAVNLEVHSVTVYHGAQLVLTTPAAVGTPSTPTPPDHTYLWELIRPDNPAGAYGPYIFGLAEFSDTYSIFNGGDAQIGIHGQDEPWSIGLAASHGCVRLENSVITQLASLLPLGTPVTIS